MAEESMVHGGLKMKTVSVVSNIFILVGFILLTPWLGDVLFAVGPDYWNHVYVETYKGYEIYHFTTIGVYGVIKEGEYQQPPQGDWKYYGSVESARKGIDNFVEEPIFIETYGDWDIYQEPGGRYYAVHSETGEETSRWMTLADLKRYIDGPDGKWQLSIPGRVIEVGLEEDLLIVERGHLTFDYITDKPDLVKKAWIVLKTSKGEVIEEKKLDGPHDVGGGLYAYWASVSLPRPGVYIVEGYVDCYLRELKMVELQVKMPTMWDRLYWRLQENPLPGAALTVIGLLLKMDERLKRRRR